MWLENDGVNDHHMLHLRLQGLGTLARALAEGLGKGVEPLLRAILASRLEEFTKDGSAQRLKAELAASPPDTISAHWILIKLRQLDESNPLLEKLDQLAQDRSHKHIAKLCDMLFAAASGGPRRNDFRAPNWRGLWKRLCANKGCN